MPNWCENDLYFSGPEDEVLKFKKLVGLDKTPRGSTSTRSFHTLTTSDRWTWSQ